ncbi:MAG: nuclear transport factor 2 family protein [Agriterribacter sp.]
MTQKDISINFLGMVSAGRIDEAYEKYVHADFIHHNAYYKGDRASLRLAMKEKAIEFPKKKYQILRAIEDGAFVAVHAKVTGVFETDWAVIHIFRFADDKIIEEWDGTQDSPKDSPNEFGIF